MLVLARFHSVVMRVLSDVREASSGVMGTSQWCYNHTFLFPPSMLTLS